MNKFKKEIICINCGKKFYRYKNHEDTEKAKWCSMECRKKWHIGKTWIENGRKFIWIENGKKQRYHRYIYEKHYKIKLKKNQHIHHIDNNPLNNNILNLKLMTPAEHCRLHSRKNPFYIQCRICGKTFPFKRTRGHIQETCSHKCGASLMWEKRTT